MLYGKAHQSFGGRVSPRPPAELGDGSNTARWPSPGIAGAALTNVAFLGVEVIGVEEPVPPARVVFGLCCALCQLPDALYLHRCIFAGGLVAAGEVSVCDPPLLTIAWYTPGLAPVVSPLAALACTPSLDGGVNGGRPRARIPALHPEFIALNSSQRPSPRAPRPASRPACCPLIAHPRARQALTPGLRP